MLSPKLSSGGKISQNNKQDGVEITNNNVDIAEITTNQQRYC